MFQKMLQVGSGGESDKDYTFLENVIPFRKINPYTISDEGEYIAIYSVYRTNDSSNADIISSTSDLTMELISRGKVTNDMYTTVYKITTNSPNQQIYGSKTTNASLLIILKKS